MHLVTIIVRSTVLSKRKTYWDFPGGPLVKNLPANAGDTGDNLSLVWKDWIYPGTTTPMSCHY